MTSLKSLRNWPQCAPYSYKMQSNSIKANTQCDEDVVSLSMKQNFPTVCLLVPHTDRAR